MSLPLYRIAAPGRMDRRSFLAVTTSLYAASAWSSRALGATTQQPKFADHPFQLGVASGDPTSDGVVLWTRLAPKPLEARGGMPDEPVNVDWQVSEDEQMTKVVRQGSTPATPQFAHTVHVEVDGLQPERWYWYQFRSGGEVSPKGRARTMPAADKLADRLRLAFASCQHWESGFYTAYEHMVREDLDLVFHLGDYIYEGAGKPGGVRQHHGGKLKTLSDYRARLAQYRGDPALQAMHAAVPWIVAWDDHEFENNYAGLTPEHVAGRTAEEIAAQRAAAYQAYYEHMPLRRAALPNGPHAQLYRRASFGPLAEFFVLDTRQYRTDQPCGDGGKPPCEGVFDPNATILGEAQRNWLFQGLQSSRAKWNVLAQQVMMGRVDFKPGDGEIFSMDQWPGYEVDRRRVLKFLHDKKIANPVVLTGDIHANWANELALDFDNLGGALAAAEFVGTSISSSGDGRQEPAGYKERMSENPFIKFHNTERGYVRCEITPEKWHTDYRTVEYVTRKGAPLNTRASFVLEAGSSQLHKA